MQCEWFQRWQIISWHHIALIDAKMSLGEGRGAVAAIPLLEMGVNVYRKMSTFEEIKVEQYEELK